MTILALYLAVPSVALALSFVEYRKIGGIHWLAIGRYRASICRKGSN